MKPRHGLRARFALLAGVVLLALLALVALVLQRQGAGHAEVRSLSLDAIQELASRRMLSHGEASTLQPLATVKSKDVLGDMSGAH